MGETEKKLKVLVVDDSSTNTFLLDSLLKEEGFDVFTTISGKKAIEIAAKQLPHIILLDIMMPGMSGYDVLEIIKKDNTLKNIPVIIVTAKEQKDEYEKVKKMGAVDYIQKPIDLSLLVEKVKMHTRH